MILLLTYSLGFAHNIIPHSHDSETEHHEENHEHEGHHHHHHHHHHSTSKQLTANHEHITHGNHFDEGLYDLLICFLHEAHQEDECENQHYIPANTNRIIINKLQVNKLVATLFSITLESEMSELISENQIDSETSYLSPSVEDTPLRGPPSIS